MMGWGEAWEDGEGGGGGEDGAWLERMGVAGEGGEVEEVGKAREVGGGGVECDGEVKESGE